MNVDDCITYIGCVGDVCYLRTPLLPVNMRLMSTSLGYRALVQACCAYLRQIALCELEGYGRPFGMSGANLALPFNIIGVVYGRGTPTAFCEIMLNPRILEYQGSLEYASSNCGSIRLKENLEVLRYSKVKLRYFDESGTQHERWFDKAQGAYTIQHEVDHNLGVLITDHGRIEDANRPTAHS